MCLMRTTEERRLASGATPTTIVFRADIRRMDCKANDLSSCCLIDPLDQRLNGCKEIMETISEMSYIMRTDLDDETLTICFKLLDSGVNAEALAQVVIGLRKERADISMTAPNK